MILRKIYNLLNLRTKEKEEETSLDETIKYLESLNQKENLNYSSKDLADRLHLRENGSYHLHQKPQEVKEKLQEISERNKETETNYQIFSGPLSQAEYFDIKIGNLEEYIKSKESLKNFDPENYKGIPEKEIHLSLKS